MGGGLHKRRFVYLAFIVILLWPWSLVKAQKCNEINHQFHEGTWSRYKQEVLKYWQNQLPHFYKEHPGKFNKLHQGMDLTYFTLFHGAKVAFAPQFFAVDLPLSFYRAYKGMRHKDADYKRALLLPVDIVQRNGVHVLTYLILSSLGYNFSKFTMESKVYRDEMLEFLDPLTLASHELTVFLMPHQEEFYDYFHKVKAVYYNNGAKSHQVKKIMNSHSISAIAELMHVKTKSYQCVKDFHILAHGKPGSFNLGDSASETSGIFSQKSLERMKPYMGQMPSDLFCDNARIIIHSCTVARGEEGESFLKQIGAFILQNEGQVIAPTVPLGLSVTRRQVDQKVKTLTFEDTREESFVAQLSFHLLLPLLNYFGVHEVMNYILHGAETQKIKSVDIGTQNNEN